MHRLALRATQFSIQLVPRFLPIGKVASMWCWPFISIWCWSKEWVELYLYSFYMPSWCGKGQPNLLHVFVLSNILINSLSMKSYFARLTAWAVVIKMWWDLGACVHVTYWSAKVIDAVLVYLSYIWEYLIQTHVILTGLFGSQSLLADVGILHSNKQSCQFITIKKSSYIHLQ